MNDMITAIIVLYNVHYDKSITFQSLQHDNTIPIVICDNSTIPLNNQKVEEEYSNVTYLSMGGNVGLSKAYNKAIDFLGKTSGYICLFDDDTKVGENYFPALRQAIEKSHADIYLPTVFDEFGILSPCNQKGVKSVRISSLKELDREHITGINSAMAIRLDIFQNYRYDESYFLDYVDHAFLRDMKRLDKKIDVFDAHLQQRFSGNDIENVKGARARFKIYYKDFYHFCDNNMSDRIYAFLTIAKRWVAINCRKPVRFYKKHFKNQKSV